MRDAIFEPIRYAPPVNTVGVVAVMPDDLVAFKFSLHSVLAFADHPYMIAVAEACKTLTIRKYLRVQQKNHAVNHLSFDAPLAEAEQANRALQYLFAKAEVQFGVILGEAVILEPWWLSKTLARLMASKGPDVVHATASCGPRSGKDYVAFRRGAWEKLGSKFTDDFCERASEVGLQIEQLGNFPIHKLNGRVI